MRHSLHYPLENIVGTILLQFICSNLFSNLGLSCFRPHPTPLIYYLKWPKFILICNFIRFHYKHSTNCTIDSLFISSTDKCNQLKNINSMFSSSKSFLSRRAKILLVYDLHNSFTVNIKFTNLCQYWMQKKISGMKINFYNTIMQFELKLL